MSRETVGIKEGADASILIDSIGGTGYPISKMILGSEGVDGGFVHTGNPVPNLDDTFRSLASSTSNGHLVQRKFGKIPELSSSDQVVWPLGGQYAFPTGAAPVRVRSGGNTADGSGFDGATLISIQGLDENWTIYEETVITSGTSQSLPTTGNFIRVNRAHVKDVGVYGGTNSGNIIIESDSDGSALAYIEAGKGQTQQAIYTTPSGYTTIIKSVNGYADTRQNKTASVVFFRRDEANNIESPKATRVIVENNNIQGEYSEPFIYSEKIPEMTDLFCVASSAAAGSLNVRFYLYQLKN